MIGRSPTVWYSDVTIDEGSSSGIERNDAVVNGDGLVGRITDVTAGTAKVELITDHDNAVSAQVLPSGPTRDRRARGRRPRGPAARLHRHQRDDPGEPDPGHRRLVRTAQISSAYPPGIPIGRVSEAEAGEQQEFQRVHVRAVRRPARARVRAGAHRRPRAPGGARMIVTPQDRAADRADRDRRRDPPGLVLLLPVDPRRRPRTWSRSWSSRSGCSAAASSARSAGFVAGLPARLAPAADARRLLARAAARSATSPAATARASRSQAGSASRRCSPAASRCSAPPASRRSS